MTWSQAAFAPTNSTLRWFGIFAASLSAGVAGRDYYLYGVEPGSTMLLGLAFVLGIVGCRFPSWLRPIFVSWMIAVYPIHWMVSHLLLALFYYCLLTPLGVFFKLISRDALERRFRDGQPSYWTDKPVTADVHRYFRQS